MKGFEVVYSCDGMWGAVFNMAFFPLFACYIGGGVYCTVKVQGKPPVFTRASFPHPHRLLWESWYALVLDGVSFTRAQVRICRPDLCERISGIASFTYGSQIVPVNRWYKEVGLHRRRRTVTT